MPTFNETTHAGEFILSEGNGSISRENVTVASGEDLAAGTVVGQVTLGAGSAVADAGNTGDGAMGAITVGGDAQVGDYVLTVTEAAADAGAFQVVDPQGDVVGIGAVGAAFAGGGLSFTLADGAADFAVGDFFTLTVAEGSNEYVAYDDTNTDGSNVAAGILYAAVNASVAAAAGVIIARDAEVASDSLIGLDAAGTVDLASRGIIVR